nr:hypothetical protein [Tanacetum cinerariifolium]
MPKILSQAWEKFFEIQHAQPEDTNELFQKVLEDLYIIKEELSEYINSPSWNYPTFYDDEEHSVQYKEYLEKSPDAITPILPTEEPEYSLSMGYEHLSITPETELDEVTESSAKNLLPIPSEYEVTSDDENEYDVPIKDDSSPEFSGELAHINPILPEIKEADFDLEEEIRFVENLLYDNSSPRPSKELNTKITDMIVESLSPSPIPVEDSDSLMDEIDLFLATDDLLPLRIESDDYDSEGNIYFLEELLVDDSIPLPENKSSNFDYHDDSSFLRPPPEPPDVEFYFDFEPNSGEVISAVMNNNDELIKDECFDLGGEINVFTNVKDDDYFPFIFVTQIFLPYLIYPEVFPLLLSPESEDTILTLDLTPQ